MKDSANQINDLPAEYRTVSLETLPQGLQNLAVALIRKRFCLLGNKEDSLDTLKMKLPSSFKHQPLITIRAKVIDKFNGGIFWDKMMTFKPSPNTTEDQVEDLINIYKIDLLHKAKEYFSNRVTWTWYDDEFSTTVDKQWITT